MSAAALKVYAAILRDGSVKNVVDARALEAEAQLAVKSEYWETGKGAAQNRRSDVSMNTEIRTLRSEPGDAPS